MSGTDDVIIVGAGPAGSLAALVLARAGARVRLVDRATFPRPKLCGDTVNPGAVETLRRFGLADSLEVRSLPISGMILTGLRGTVVRSLYGEGNTGSPVQGWAVSRRILDSELVAAAIDAGAQFDERVSVEGPILANSRAGSYVRGVLVRGRSGKSVNLPAAVTIAADGRRSLIARKLGLARSTRYPRRWVVGGYFDAVEALSSFGEMHVRQDHYIGVAPVPEGLANVCVVSPVRSRFAEPEILLRQTVASDPVLAHRFLRAKLVGQVTSLGPMGVDGGGAGLPGLLLAGDAAGFIDPITGDGVRFALRGGELAALTALWMMETGCQDGHERLRRLRATDFSCKWRFNRAVRAVVGSTLGVAAGSMVADLLPGVLRRVVEYAGDTQLCRLSR